ncbi:exopolysaccharide biosynthesis protein [Haliea sp. E1-2-M8]|uniref:exopolysaccharide biosynthesis protein n=1 Tax=Haliea sp. E1-2-M8 TaxID=3064706 RepID=UPI002727A068|nr:exopolysaccharide biosynthesis protein [Haliea sp. E1-2-M8]MDO8861037.1 exopolysaccharide biosynthesis protein [Haliea sp. E1-2-M8]
MLEQIAIVAHNEHTLVTVGDILEAVGTRSFAPLLMLTGTLLVSPLSGIPLFPSMMALIVLLVSLQMLAGRRHFWLPRWLLQRTLPRQKLLRILEWLQTPCATIDRYLQPRLTYLVRGPSTVLIALTCLAIAVMMPAMELVLFSSSIAGVALCAFGLALVAHDGVLVLVAYAIITLMAAVVAGVLPWEAAGTG